MNKSRNLCFETNPDEIADIMYGCNGITLSDCIEAIIGLGRIVSQQRAQISNQYKNYERLYKNQRELYAQHSRALTLKGDSMDSKFTVDQMKTVLQSVSEKMKEENFKDNDLAYKIDSLSNQIEKAVTRNGIKENVNIVLVIW